MLNQINVEVKTNASGIAGRTKGQSVRSIRPIIILCLLLSLVFAVQDCGLNVASAATRNDWPVAEGNGKWVASWADAPSELAGGTSTEQTFREIVKPTVGSRGTVRLHFSNYFGTETVTLGAVHIGIQSKGSAVSMDTAITFNNGAVSVSIPAGGFVTSDDIAFDFSYGDVLAITEYVQGRWNGLTAHAQGVDIVTNYATPSGAGNQVDDTAGTSFSITTFNTYLLDRVDVFGDYTATIAAFGSSTTDGYMNGFGLNQHMTYPEQLAAALHAAGHDDVAIANVGIYGTTVLGSSSTAGVNRFARDVLTLPGVTAVIDYLGANDLREDCIQQVDKLITGKQNIIAQAHKAKLQLYLATTAPSTFCGAQRPGAKGTRFPQGSGEEAERFKLVSWEQAKQPVTIDGTLEKPPAADAVIDFNGVLADPSNLSYMLTVFDSGDDIHPNATGYGVMARSIPLSLLLSSW